MSDSLPKISANDKRIAMEKRIAKKVFAALIDAGYALKIDNGEELSELLLTVAAAVRVMWQTDVEFVMVYKIHGLPTGVSLEEVGWVLLVYGNGASLISDYTEDLESVLEPVMDYADGQE